MSCNNLRGTKPYLAVDIQFHSVEIDDAGFYFFYFGECPGRPPTPYNHIRVPIYPPELATYSLSPAHHHFFRAGIRHRITYYLGCRIYLGNVSEPVIRDRIPLPGQHKNSHKHICL